MVLSWVRLIRVKLVLVNLNPINDTYILLSRDKNFEGRPKHRSSGGNSVVVHAHIAH